MPTGKAPVSPGETAPRAAFIYSGLSARALLVAPPSGARRRSAAFTAALATLAELATGPARTDAFDEGRFLDGGSSVVETSYEADGATTDRRDGPDRFVRRLEFSTDGGASWWRRAGTVYTR